MNRWQRGGKWLVRAVVLVVAIAVALIILAAAAIRTEWGHERLRMLVVSQANRVLDATLSLGGVSGSLLWGIELQDVTLSRDGETLVAIDRVHVIYGLRQLIDQGTTIQRIALERPHIVLKQRPNGRWNFSDLIRRTGPPGQGPGRHVRIDSLDMQDGRVEFQTPVSLGPAHVPTTMTGVNAQLSIDTQGGAWTFDVSRASLNGAAPTLNLQNVHGEIATSDTGWTLR